MARIWFSVCGDGNGHAVRSSILIEHLQKKNDLLITASQKAYPYLKERFQNVHKIEGFSFIYEDNEVNIPKTFEYFSKHLLMYSSTNLKMLSRLLMAFKPQVIISDFEPTSHWSSFGLPIINIDNVNLLSRGKLVVTPEYKKELNLARTFIRVYLGNIPKTSTKNYFLIPTFTFPEVKKRTALFKPLLRKEVLKRKPTIKKHILVYQTTDTNTDLFKTLQTFSKQEFIVYGFNKNQLLKNIRLKKFSVPNFLDDLASAQAVIVNGGHNVICESLYYRKPVLIVPIKKQFEQVFNGLAVNTECFGTYTHTLTPEVIRNFVNNLDWYRKNIQEKLGTWDNKEFFVALDEKIKEVMVEDPKLFDYSEALQKIRHALFEKKTSRRNI